MLRHIATCCFSLMLAVAAVGCGGTPTATFSAGDLTAVQEALALRGVSIQNAVSGDPGCPDSELHSNAVRLDVDVGDAEPATVHLLRWRRPAQFTDAAASFERCVAGFESAAPSGNAEVLEVPPWRAFGVGWSDTLRQSLEDALRAVGGT